MVEKKVENKGEEELKLTPTEQDVLYLLTKDFLTPKRIAIRRKTSDKAVYKIISKLKKKGIINAGFQEVEKTRGTIQPFQSKGHYIRLHGQEFNINILFKDHRYKEVLEKCNVINIDGNTIKLNRNSIEVYSGQSFYADEVQKATVRSFAYWNRFFARLEHDIKVILIKPRSQNVRLVNHHYSEVNNEFAKECEKKADKIRIYTTDDGKLWFTIDNSFNLHEAETQHPRTAQEDMQEAVKPFFNDLRDNSPPTLSAVMGLIRASVAINKETAAGLNIIVQLLNPKQPEDKQSEGRPDYFG